MQKVLAALLAGIAFAGTARAEPVRTAPSAYAGVGVSGVDYVGAATKASPKVFGGVQFGKQAALEAGAIDFKHGYGMYIAVKPSLPLTEKLSAYGKLGVAQTRSAAALPTLPGQTISRKTETGAYGAFGLQYSITPNTAIKLEVERLPREKPSVLKSNVWTMALQFFF